MSIPAKYSYINAYNSYISPSTMHCQNTALVNYYAKYLLQQVFGMYKLTVPETWPKNYFLHTLFIPGFVCILQTDKYGTIPQQATLGGYNVFYNPRKAIIANPLLTGIKELTIDEDCTIVQLQPDYSGIADIIAYYADALAICTETVLVNVANSKMSYVFTAKDKGAAESFKKMYDQIAAGNAMVVQHKSLLSEQGGNAWSFINPDVKSNFVANEILTATATIRSNFMDDVGIPNVNYEKKERLLEDEVNANNVSTATKASLWLESVQDGMLKAHKMFPGLSRENFWMDFRFNGQNGDYMDDMEQNETGAADVETEGGEADESNG